MAPSAVNDPARAMRWRGSPNGATTSPAPSRRPEPRASLRRLPRSQGFDNFADMNGAMIAFVPHITNVATVTLNADVARRRAAPFPASAVELQSGVLIQGTPYVASYNNSDGAWYLQGGFANPYGILPGGLLPYTGASAPNSAFVLLALGRRSPHHLRDLFFLGGDDVRVGGWLDHVQCARLARALNLWPSTIWAARLQAGSRSRAATSTAPCSAAPAAPKTTR